MTIDDIIARRQQSALQNSPGGSEQEDLPEVEHEDDLQDSGDELDGPEQEGSEDGSSLNLGEDDFADLDDLVGGDNIDASDLEDEPAPGVEEDITSDLEDDEDSGSADSSDDSPFAKLANATVSLSEAEDEDINFAQAADKQIADDDYFDKAPRNGSSKTITSNQALTSSSIPPFSAMPGASLSRPLLLGLSSLNLTTPTPIQAQTIPVALLGKDIVGSSITGSGKTVAFWVGILERLLYRDKKEARTRVVVICPTRELAVQVHNVGQALARYTDIRFCLCVGGLSLKVQEADLKKRPDIVVSTPGRLIDHVRNTPSFSLESLEILVIDEADRILEEGFRDELTEIIDSCPHNRQTMLFSATITEDIQTLARLSLQKPVRIAIDAAHTTSTNLSQEFVKVKQEALREAILVGLCEKSFSSQGKTIVFFRSKVGAHRMKILFELFGLKADELHGDLSQEMRLTALKRFKEGEVAFLLATDLASVSSQVTSSAEKETDDISQRGLDIKGIETVINFEMPRSFEIYLHRVGRTARAGKTGRAITLVAESDRKMVKQALKASADSGRSDETKQLTMPSELVKSTYMRVQELRPEIREIVQEEKEERELRRTEMELTKGQNMLEHESEIKARPARTWFQSQKEKERAKDAGKKEYNDKIDGAEGSSNATRGGRAPQPLLNHKQRRRKEALQELRIAKGSGNISSAIRSAKKEMRPGAISQMGADTDKRGHLANGKTKRAKSKKAKGSGFKDDLGEKRKSASGPASAAKAGKKTKKGTGPIKKSSSSLSRGKKGKH